MPTHVDGSTETGLQDGGGGMKKNGTAHKSERKSRDAVSEVIRQAGLAVLPDQLEVAAAIRGRAKDAKKSSRMTAHSKAKR